MNLYIYSDESGVFDNVHNKYFIFAGLILFGKDDKEILSRKYAKTEKHIRSTYNYPIDMELKACKVSNIAKGKLFRSLNNCFKFCALINQDKVNSLIFENKRHKQRYLDYAYKIVIKKALQHLLKAKLINQYKIKNMYFYVDEHQTATDGLYELEENLLSEFKYGTFNSTWDKCYEPLFPQLENLEVRFCDSKTVRLIRAADIIANRFLYLTKQNNGVLTKTKNSFIFLLPESNIVSYGNEFFLHQSST